MNAWLLTWEGTTGHAVRPERKIIAILSSRRSSKTIIQLGQTLYHISIDTAYDMAGTANNTRMKEQRLKHLYSTDSRYFYGTNPCIFARKVIDLCIQKNEASWFEILQWTEPAVFGNAVTGSGLEEKWPARQCEHTRPLISLAGE